MTIRKLDNLFGAKIDDLKLPNIVAFMTDIMTSEDKAADHLRLFKQGAGEPCRTPMKPRSTRSCWKAS